MANPNLFNLLIQLWEVTLIALQYWWVYVPIVLAWYLRKRWTDYLEDRYDAKQKRLVLEISIPIEVRKSPVAMEQFLANIHVVKSGHNFARKYWGGFRNLPFSLEIVSHGGEIHFYIQTIAKYKDLIEANLYAQYSDIDILEVDDYVDEFPKKYDDLEKSGYELAGSEFLLAKKDVYPIRTYTQFEAMEEEKSLDPISVLIEVFGKAKPHERIWMQIVILPTGSDWKDAAKGEIDKIKEEAKVEIAGDDGTSMKSIQLSPGQRDVVEAMEKNVAKVGYQTLIRYVYIAPKDNFDDGLTSKGIKGALNQYASQDLNAFSGDGLRDTGEYLYLFPERRALKRKKTILSAYVKRSMAKNLKDKKAFVLNTEELATIYHLPTFIVLTAPSIKRVESKKIGPPAGLPMFGE